MRLWSFAISVSGAASEGSTFRIECHFLMCSMSSLRCITSILFRYLVLRSDQSCCQPASEAVVTYVLELCDIFP